MSYGVMAYAIDFDVIRRIVGSKDQQVLEDHEADFEDDAASIDELLENQSDGDDEAPLPAARDALRQMIMGESLDDRVGFAYAYCLKFLCDAHGEFLDNRTWYPISARFLESVQKALDAAGVPNQTISVAHLTAGESPIPIPFVDDFPGIGFLARSAVPDAFEALSRVNPVDIADTEARESIGALTEWLATCRKSDRDLICFYH
jgi:hypothetical protein